MNKKPPAFSILTPVYNPDVKYLKECIDSVLQQTTSEWELCLVADGPQPKEVNKVLNSYKDKRIKVHFRETNGGISVATDDALNMATGEFIALLDNDDVLPPDALGTVAWEIDKYDDADFVFSDEDHLDYPNGERIHPFFKPGFSMDRLRQQMYLGHLIVCRRKLALEVGGFRPGFDGSQDHDLVLRVVEQSRRILHIPQILYHWRESPTSTALDSSSKDWAYEAGVRVVQSHLERTGFPAKASRNPDWPGIINLEPQLEELPLVSIIIPTGMSSRIVNGADQVLIDRAVESIIESTTYPNYEIIIVLDKKSAPNSCDHLLNLGSTNQIRVIKDDRDFNFAMASNLGAAHANGQLFIFHNDDTEIIQSNWIQRMVMYATQKDIGAVGVKLLFGDGRINHVGIWSKEGHAGHRYRDYAPDHPGYLASMTAAQNCIAVTGACLAVERVKFEQVGGFSTIFPLAYNDVDLCLKLNRAGFRSVADCATTVLHHESSTRSPEVESWEMQQIFDRWKPLLKYDPYMNPNHSSEGVEEYPPPSIRMVIHLEDNGSVKHSSRAWPAEKEYFLC